MMKYKIHKGKIISNWKWEKELKLRTRAAKLSSAWLKEIQNVWLAERNGGVKNVFEAKYNGNVSVKGRCIKTSVRCAALSKHR